MERALAETVITGIAQTVPFHRRLVRDEAFKRADLHTGFIADHLHRLVPPPTEERPVSSAGGDAVPADAAGPVATAEGERHA